MADTKISALTSATLPLSGSELVPIVQSGTTVKTAISNIASNQPPTPYTANGVVYASSTSALATGSGLQFDGANLGLGVAPSAWSTDYAVVQFPLGGAVASYKVAGYPFTSITSNAYNDGTNWKYVSATSAGATVFRNEGYNSDFVWSNAPGGTAGANITFTSRMTLDSSGNLLVGQTSTTDGGGICVSKSSNGATMANFYNTYGSGAQTLRTSMVAGANNTSSYHYVASSGGDKLYIYGNGNVVNTNNSYGTLSDIKLKDNIVDASSKLADVMQLKVRNFNLKTDPEHKQIGFIAQEFEQVFPALIDNTTSPNDPDDVIKSIKTSVLVPILVKSIQEQQAIITQLTTRLTALENK